MDLDTSWLDMAGRLLFVTYFVVAGLCYLVPARVTDHIQRMGASGTPFPALVHWAGITLQFTGCALILSGWRAEIGVMCLIVFTIVATAISPLLEHDGPRSAQRKPRDVSQQHRRTRRTAVAAAKLALTG